MPTAAETMLDLHVRGSALRDARIYFVQGYQRLQTAVEEADLPLIGAWTQSMVIRNYAEALEQVSERLRRTLVDLEPIWPRAVQLANNPEVNGLNEKQTNQVQAWCQFVSGEINQTQTLLEMYYRSRWYNESPRRVPRFMAYTVHAMARGSEQAVQAVYRTAVGPEYIQEQEEARQALEDLENDSEGFNLTSAGGLAVGIGAGLLGVWFMRRNK